MKSAQVHKLKVQRINWIKLFFFLSLVTVFAFLLIKINNMFISVLLAIVLSQLLRPLVDWIEERFGIERFSATLSVFGIAGGLGGLIVFLTMPFLTEQFQIFRQEMSSYIAGASQLLDQAETKAKAFIPMIEDFGLTERVKNFLISQTTGWAQEIPIVITNSFSVFFLCPFLGFFMVKDSYKINRGFLSLVPNHVFETTLSLTHQISQQIGRFIRARMFEAFIVGLITSIGLYVISFPFALLLGLFAGLMNLIPYIGPVIGFLPALLIGISKGFDVLNLAQVAGAYAAAQVIDNVVLIPFLVARIMKLHPVTVVVLVIAGAQFMGILGMIISIPVANAIQVTYQSIYQHILSGETRA